LLSYGRKGYLCHQEGDQKKARKVDTEKKEGVREGKELTRRGKVRDVRSYYIVGEEKKKENFLLPRKSETTATREKKNPHKIRKRKE